MDFVADRCARYPDMHIYHFAPYEPAALKRLMTKHSTREEDVDNLLRAVRFVDLYARRAAGHTSQRRNYSIKQLEQFYAFKRHESLESAKKSLLEVERLLALNLTSELTDEHKRVVVDYNKDDCLSTLRLRDWLEDLRSQQIAKGVVISTLGVEMGDEPAAPAKPIPAARLLFERLVAGLDPEKTRGDRLGQVAIGPSAGVLSSRRQE